MFRLFAKDKAGNEHPVSLDLDGDDAPPAAPPTPQAKADGPPDLSAKIAELTAQLAESSRREAEATAKAKAEAEARAAADCKAKADGILSAASAFGDKFAAKLTPAARTSAARLHAFAGLSAAGLPAVDADGKPLDARADLDAFCAALPDHGLGAGSIVASEAKGLVPLANGAQGSDEMAEIRRQNDEHFASRVPVSAN